MKSVRKLALVTSAVFAAALTASAVAQDSPAGPGANDAPAPPAPGAPAAPDKPADPAVKKERKVDPKAQAAFDRYMKLVATPASSGAKSASCKSEIDIGMGTVTIESKWSEKDGHKAKYHLPEELLAQVPPEMQSMIEKQLDGQLGNLIEPFFGGLGSEIAQYDLAAKEGDGKVVVTMTAFAEKAQAESQKITFNAEGFVTRIVSTPKVDMNDPQAAAMAGTEIEVDVKHAKKGEKHVVSGYDVTLPFGVISVTASYFDGTADIPLVKSLEIVNPMSPAPQSLTFCDWVIDGKAVDGTAKKKAEEKPAPATPDAPKEGTGPGTPAGPEAGPGK